MNIPDARLRRFIKDQNPCARGTCTDAGCIFARELRALFRTPNRKRETMAKSPPPKPKTGTEKYGKPSEKETPAQKLGKAVPIFGKIADAMSGKGEKKPAKK